MVVCGRSLIRNVVHLAIAGAVVGALPAVAQQLTASPERRDAAIGHYARARAMLVEALAEFEQGRKLAQPDLLIDPEEWRLSLISRTEELNKVLDPQPRVTRSGIRFKASGLHIKRAKDQLPPVVDGARDSNLYGEEDRAREREAARARFLNETETPAATQPNPDAVYSEIIKQREKAKELEKNEDALLSLPELKQENAETLSLPTPSTSETVKSNDTVVDSTNASDTTGELTGAASGERSEEVKLSDDVQKAIEARIKASLEEDGAIVTPSGAPAAPSN